MHGMECLRSLFCLVPGIAFVLALSACGNEAKRPKLLPDMLVADSPDMADPFDPDRPCVEQKFVQAKPGDPDILIVQDRSNSMKEGKPTKWSQVIGATQDVVVALDLPGSRLHFGLMLFPTDDACGVSAKVAVPVAMDQGQWILNTLKETTPGGETPMEQAITLATAYYDTLKDERGHYILLATDGEPNCEFHPCSSAKDCRPGEQCAFNGPQGNCYDPGGGGALRAIAAARAKGIKTFVIGISLRGTSVPLSNMAEAGGTARIWQPPYFPVGNQWELELALQDIANDVVQCSFTLLQVPTPKQEVIVKIDGIDVTQDRTHKNGWDIDTYSKTLTFYGQMCDVLKDQRGAVSVSYACPPPG